MAYVAYAENIAILGELLNLLAVCQLSLMRSLILFAIFVEEIDDVKTLILVIADKYLEGETKE